MSKEKALALASLLEACAEDAKRPQPMPEYGQHVTRSQPASVISLANGLLAIAAAIRADHEA